MRAGSKARLLPLLLLIACVACSVYPNPHVDLVLYIDGADASEQVFTSIRRFARARQLVESSPTIDRSVSESHRRLDEKTTYFGTGSPRGEGRALTYLNASQGCKVLRVVERSSRWGAAAQADLDELRALLAAIPGVTVEQGATFEPNVSPGRGLDDYCPLTP